MIVAFPMNIVSTVQVDGRRHHLQHSTHADNPHHRTHGGPRWKSLPPISALQCDQDRQTFSHNLQDHQTKTKILLASTEHSNEK